ncbi:acyl-CoA dehydrogenase family protein [Sulfitobacter sp. F26204]|uniref:acyl-CoA dehydrogenase family protein n=1 Tax=Sulfitobacter sp. F26204 TaxID=2996014 RepID=UPI00225E1705|nr:acyl-CoA dehydrogenase family protein [Sulfitobacter sp. F26204]MCX7561716.1 acyl-CoA dehydrogenase family protein [Sulfitobacter sp. F26204]
MNKQSELTEEPIVLDAVLQEVRDRREEYERLTYVHPDMIAKMQSVGVYRALVPKSMGGDELSPGEFCQLVERFAEADGSTGWVASFGIAPTYLSALPKKTFEKLYGANRDTVFAGSIFPPQPAQRVSSGVKVKGQWPYCSGCMGASYIGVGIKIDEGNNDAPGLPRMAVLPREQVSIKHTWDTVGLTATGSHDVAVDDVVVSEDWTFIRGASSLHDEAIYRYPTMAFAAQVLAVVGLGVAREALNWLHAEAMNRPSITGAPSIGARPYVHEGLARAEAKLRSARSFFYDTIDEAWTLVVRGDAVPDELKVRLRLACTQAAHEGAEVARQAYYMAGASALRRGHTLSRTLVDASAVAQHAFFGMGTWSSAGAGFLGQNTPPGYP